MSVPPRLRRCWVECINQDYSDVNRRLCRKNVEYVPVITLNLGHDEFVPVSAEERVGLAGSLRFAPVDRNIEERSDQRTLADTDTTTSYKPKRTIMLVWFHLLPDTAVFVRVN